MPPTNSSSTNSLPQVNTQVLLAGRPVGMPTQENFHIVQTPLPEATPGKVLCRTIYLSLDPYMRGRMNAGRSYVEPVEVGQVMCGSTVGQVVALGPAGQESTGKMPVPLTGGTAVPQLRQGDLVLGYGGWQEYFLAEPGSLRKLDPAQGKLSWALGVLGMPGMTAYVGMLDIGQPKAGQTVVVSAAAGAVGSVAGQIAKLKGCRVVGSAGSDEKCQVVTGEFGFDACFNYKTTRPFAGLKKNCPSGIDVYFDNVGGVMLEAALRLINVGARIPLIGLISQYNATEFLPGPNLTPVLVRRATIKGMIVSDHADRQGDFLRDMSGWLREGKIRCRETIVDGLANAPRAFLGLFSGENVGKLLVKVGDDPTAH
jgi:hypothetical protein